jgi:hypothetical protein
LQLSAQAALAALWEASSQQPAASSQQPAASSQQPAAASSQQPAAASSQQAASSRQQAAAAAQGQKLTFIALGLFQLEAQRSAEQELLQKRKKSARRSQSQ